MEVAVLLLLPLVGGYIFARTCNFTRFKSFREEGHRLYFRAVFYGVFLLAVCLLVRLYLFAAWPSYGEIETDIAPFLSFVGKEPSKGNPVPIAIAGAASMLLAYPLGKFLNLFLWKWVYVEQAAHTDDFERILHEAVLRTIPICATMENRKVYVGFVRKTFEATQELRSLAIIPLTSGYRSG